MLKEAIEKIVELAHPTVIEVEGKTFSTDDFSEVVPEYYYPRTIELNTLDGIVRMIEEEAVNKFAGESKLYVRVSEYNRVDVFTSYDTRMKRSNLYLAQADVPGFRGGFKDRETMLIQLRSLFMQTADVAYLLDLLSRMTDKENVVAQDNGVSQTVEVKRGVSLKEAVEVRPRVKLTPFRTFLEVEQPESEFILRVADGGQIGLFEADGGVWKLVAKRSIAKYLEECLSKHIASGAVAVMM